MNIKSVTGKHHKETTSTAVVVCLMQHVSKNKLCTPKMDELVLLIQSNPKLHQFDINMLRDGERKMFEGV